MKTAFLFFGKFMCRMTCPARLVRRAILQGLHVAYAAPGAIRHDLEVIVATMALKTPHLADAVPGFIPLLVYPGRHLLVTLVTGL